MSIVTRTIVLTGGRKGLTVRLGLYQFTDGKIVLRGPSQDVEALSHWLAVNYQAYPEGSDELEASHGERDLPATAEPHDQEQALLSGVQPRGAGAPEAEADDGSGAAGADGGEAGLLAERDRYEYSWLHRFQEAVNRLDHENDNHWTSQGLPAVSAVSKLMGEQVTRAAIHAAAPRFCRVKGD